MNDDDLIARLRSAGKHPMMDNNCKVDVFDVHSAADRIEQLVKEKDHAWKMAAEADTRLGQVLGAVLNDKQKLEAAEARAERLEAALRPFAQEHSWGPDARFEIVLVGQHGSITGADLDRARAALKGDDHE